MRRVPPFTDRVLIGVGRSNTRPLVCVSVTITFRTVQARASAVAGTRRGIYGFNQPRCRRVACPQCLCDQRQCEIIRLRESAIGQCRVPLPAQSSRHHRQPEYFVQPATWLICNEIRRAIGILAKHNGC